VQAHIGTLLQPAAALREPGIQALLCAAVLLIWRQLHRQLRGDRSFLEVLEHSAANIGFWGAVALSTIADTRVAGLAMLLVLAAVSIRAGLRSNQEAFVVYGIAYTALGLCIVELQVIQDEFAVITLALLTIIAATMLLWIMHQRLRRAPP
jgi:hypothetical protein